jgi:PAS domain S-box-containing protein
MLWAEDNADMRDYVSRLLGERFEVEAVADGQAALEAARARPPDLVLCDIMMPRLDGIGLLRELRSDSKTSEIPIILLSARAGEESRVEGLAAGADDYLIKPFSARELVARVQTHVKMARLRRKAVESLRQSEHRFREMIDALPFAIYTTDSAGRLTHFNPAAVEFSGRTPQLGTDHWCVTWKLYYPDGRPMPHDECPMAIALREGRIVRTEAIAERPDGRRVWFEPYPTPLRDSAGNVVGGINMLVDITARKVAEKALRESEARFRNMADTAPAMMWVSEPNANCSFLSRGWFEFTGQTEATGLGDGWLDAVHPADRDQSGHIFLEANARQESFALEYRLRRHDGEYRWVMDAGRPRFAEDGTFLGHIGAVIDIHERKEAEEAQVKLATIVAYSDDAIISKDLHGVITSWNRGAERVFGYTADEAIGQPVTMLMPPERINEEPGILARIRRGESVEHYETVRRRKDGTLLDISLTVSPIVNFEGRIVGASKIARDITERKRAETELAKSRQLLNELIECCPFGIYIVDSDFKIAKMNVASQEGAFTNVRPVIGRPFDQAMRILWPEPVAAEIIAHFRCTLDTGQPYYSKDFVNARDDIQRVEGYEWELHRVTLPDGMFGVICYYYDSTKLRQAQHALREADRKKDEFLAMLAHELRNPLAAIQYAVEVAHLTSKKNGDETTEIIDHQVKQLTHLIDDLLDVSRITRGKIQLKNERLDAAPIVRHAVNTVRPLIDNRRHEITLDVSAEEMPLDGDATRLEQVLVNLLTNAAKYTPDGGRIFVSAAPANGQVVLRVRDNGVGISEDMLPNIFELFSQVDKSLDRAHGGLGIGLSVVRALVEMHGGTISATSPGMGQGSEFVVRLPIAKSAEDSRRMAGLHAAPGESRVKILVIEDNAPAAKMLRMLLTSRGHAVEVASDGVQGVRRAVEYRPDVILLDIGLPGFDGFEVARQLRREESLEHTTIIGLSGYGQEHDVETSRAAGFDDHLVKPIGIDQLAPHLRPRCTQ